MARTESGEMMTWETYTLNGNRIKIWQSEGLFYCSYCGHQEDTTNKILDHCLLLHRESFPPRSLEDRTKGIVAKFQFMPLSDPTTFEDFDKFFDSFIEECRKMRDSKGKEYAHSQSRFANFNRASERLGISREMVANVYLHKHLDAIDSYILRKESYSGENIRGRLIDAVTYLVLIAGMIEMK